MRWALLMVFAVAGCVPGGGGGGGGSGDDNCDDGDLRRCRCPDGEEGVSECLEGEFGQCECAAMVGEGEGEGECVDGDMILCRCQNDFGARECVSGFYDACICPDPELPKYRYIIISDETLDENMSGTPGADICGLIANCGAGDFNAVGATLIMGGGVVCDGTSMAAPCESGVSRANPVAALDNGAACEPASNPSDYVSLGLAGELAVEFNVDLAGCNITVVEWEGRQNEPYSVYACQSPLLDASTCFNGGTPIGSSPAVGGSVSIDLPDPF